MGVFHLPEIISFPNEILKNRSLLHILLLYRARARKLSKVRVQLIQGIMEVELSRCDIKYMIYFYLLEVHCQKYVIRDEHDFFSCTVCSVRPKPGFGIGNRNQGPVSVSVSEPKFFFSETETFFFLFFQIFSCISAS